GEIVEEIVVRCPQHIGKSGERSARTERIGIEPDRTGNEIALHRTVPTRKIERLGRAVRGEPIAACAQRSTWMAGVRELEGLADEVGLDRIVVQVPNVVDGV